MVLALTVAGVVIGAAAVAYRTWATKRKEELAEALELHTASEAVEQAPDPVVEAKAA